MRVMYKKFIVRPFKMSEIRNWFGLHNGKWIGEPPPYVDSSLRPGLSEVPKPDLVGWIYRAPTVLITSPNFVWAAIALCLYRFFPYDLDPTSAAVLGPLSFRFFAERLPLWLSVTLGYDALWHIALYGMKLAKRPFLANRAYNIDKVIHNIFWTSSGIVIWTGFENILCFLWATERLSYITDVASFGSVTGFCAFLLALFGVPLWRSIHFYFAHRFLHMNDMYKQVHSLHHRNTDTEPFSGLCMHPVEHIYYYACILPSLVFYCSPFAFLWNGVHLLLSPGASHSGYEDHFQSDVFHYMHHRYFECNYAGSDAAFLDIWFGTFQGSFRKHDRENPALRDDAKSTLRTVPTKEFVSYLGLAGSCFLPWILSHYGYIPSEIAALVAGVGPVFAASVVGCWSSRRVVTPVAMTYCGVVLHIVIGALFCCVPIVIMVGLSLQSIRAN